jgi:hypothetical protein
MKGGIIMEDKKDLSYKAVKVPSEYILAVESPNGDILNTEQALAKILNELTNLRKQMVGGGI